MTLDFIPSQSPGLHQTAHKCPQAGSSMASERSGQRTAASATRTVGSSWDAAAALSGSRWWSSNLSAGSSSRWSTRWGSSRHWLHQTSHLVIDGVEKWKCQRLFNTELQEIYVRYREVKRLLQLRPKQICKHFQHLAVMTQRSAGWTYVGLEEVEQSLWPRLCGHLLCWWWGWDANEK